MCEHFHYPFWVSCCFLYSDYFPNPPSLTNAWGIGFLCTLGCELVRCFLRVEVVFPYVFLILPYFWSKEEKALFIEFTTNEVFILWVLALLKYTPYHILDSYIFHVNFLEFLVIKFIVTLDHHNLCIPVHWCFLIHRHRKILTAVKSTRRNIPLHIYYVRLYLKYEYIQMYVLNILHLYWYSALVLMSSGYLVLTSLLAQYERFGWNNYKVQNTRQPEKSFGNKNTLSVCHGCSAMSYTSCTILSWIEPSAILTSSSLSSIWHPILHIWIRTKSEQFANSDHVFPWTGLKKGSPLSFL